MARRHRHEEHANHEAWAIPYGDLVTLLLAFFVVMYSISSVNEGKYRVVSDSLSQAFGGRGLPVQVGDPQTGQAGFEARNLIGSQLPLGLLNDRLAQALPEDERQRWLDHQQRNATSEARRAEALRELGSLAGELERALDSLIMQDLVTVTRRGDWLEVEIKADMLFASGSAQPRGEAVAAVQRIAGVLSEAPNLLRVEGHTDNIPIASLQFPSNWELSAARAASIVRVLTNTGVAPGRLTVAGYGEHQPIAENTSVAGRNANRRVVLVVLAERGGDSLAPDQGGR